MIDGASMTPADDVQPETTMPAGLQVTLRDFGNEDAARALGHMITAVVSRLGRHIDLSKLDGITVGIDYDEALMSLDRGMPGLRPLSRSNSEEMQGIAMSPAVMRDGEVRTHLVFNAQQLLPLIAEESDADDDHFDIAIGIIAHECAHVEITAEKERMIPECRLGTEIDNFERAVMFQLAEVCWDEYAACRISAPFHPRQNEFHARTMIGCALVARDQANAAIRSYRIHGDLRRLVSEAGPALCGPMKASAYLLGGMDAVGAEWSDFAEARNALADNGYDELIDLLHLELRQLWDRRGRWEPTMATFKGLEAVAHEVFCSGGLHFSTDEDGGCHINVPFTPWTMPE